MYGRGGSCESGGLGNTICGSGLGGLGKGWPVGLDWGGQFTIWQEHPFERVVQDGFIAGIILGINATSGTQPRHCGSRTVSESKEISNPVNNDNTLCFNETGKTNNLHSDQHWNWTIIK